MASFKSASMLGILILVLIILAAAVTAADDHTSSERHLKVDFELALDVRVGELDSESYIAFQDNLRKRLAARYIGPATNRVGVLATNDDTNPRFFDLKLTGAGGAQVTARFRTGNLYLVGYTMGSTWLEFGISGQDTKHWIPGSQFLGFKDTYQSMEGAAGKSLTQISLTAQKFQTVVKTLATSTKRNERAEGLIVVAQMVSEACRFVVLSNGFSTKLNSQTPVYLQQWMLDDLEREWGTYSEILLCYNAFPNSYVYPVQTINGKQVKTADDLRKRLGILLNVQVGTKECKIPTASIDFQAQAHNPVEPAVFEA